MIQLVLLCMLFATVTSFPMNITMTAEKLDEDLKTLSQTQMSNYIPSFILESMTNMTQEEKLQFVSLINKIGTGQIPNITDSKEMLDVIEKEAPAFAPKANKMYGEFKEKIDKLSTQGKIFMETIEKQWYTLMNTQDMETYGNEASKFLGWFYSSLQSFTPETWKSFEEQFPKYVQGLREMSNQLKSAMAENEKQMNNSSTNVSSSLMNNSFTNVSSLQMSSSSTMDSKMTTTTVDFGVGYGSL